MFLKEKNLSHFEEYGYIKLPLLSQEDIQSLNDLYDKVKLSCEIKDKLFFTSIWSNNVEYKKQVDKGIKSILEPALNSVLKDFKSVFSNFMVKKSGANSQLPPHQDWSFVDESKYYSITIWIPLKNVSKENGALEVLPKSHKLENLIRARFADSPFGNELDYIQNNLMQSIPMNAGEALFINSRTIHSSPPNISNKDRLAVSIVVTPTEAQMLHFVKDRFEEELIYQLEVETNFYCEYSCFDYPDISKSTKKIKLPATKIDKEYITKTISL